MKLVVLRGGPAAMPASRREAVREPAPTGRHGAIALSDQGHHWALLNVAPNVAGQLHDDAALGCHAGLNDVDLRTVILTDAQVDHVSGLLSLREGGPIDLYATPAVFEVLSQRVPVLQILQHYCGVHWHVIPVAGETPSARFHIDALPELEFTALATAGITPPYLGRAEALGGNGLSIAVAVQDLRTGQRLFCAPGAQTLGETELDWLRSADCVLLDEHTPWPAHGAEADPSRPQRRVRLGDDDAPSTGADQHGFEPAYDGMVIDL